MPRLKLVYFDIHGSRGLLVRLALSIGGIDFEDDRVSTADWPSRKAATPYGQLPVLEVDGQIVAQSNGINRFVGKLAGLYPTDPLQAALCDEIMDAVDDIGWKITTTFTLSDEEKRVQRQVLADGAISFYLRALQERLQARGGQYFADNRLSVADLKVFGFIRYLKSGLLDHVPADLPDRVAPALVEHFERVRNHPGVQAYFARHGLSA